MDVSTFSLSTSFPVQFADSFFFLPFLRGEDFCTKRHDDEMDKFNRKFPSDFILVINEKMRARERVLKLQKEIESVTNSNFVSKERLSKFIGKQLWVRFALPSSISEALLLSLLPLKPPLTTYTPFPRGCCCCWRGLFLTNFSAWVFLFFFSFHIFFFFFFSPFPSTPKNWSRWRMCSQGEGLSARAVKPAPPRSFVVISLFVDASPERTNATGSHTSTQAFAHQSIHRLLSILIAFYEICWRRHVYK